MQNREVKIVIPLNPITKKNHQQIYRNKKTGKPFVKPSPQYERYEREAGWYLAPLNIKKIDYPVNVQCLFYMKTRRRVDLNNLLESATDVLVKYKILKDDESKIVAGHDGSRVLYDKEFPRTEIYITRLEE